MKNKKELTATERAFLEKLRMLPTEGKLIAMSTLAGVAAVYASQQPKKRKSA